MANSPQIEYLIKPDGTIIERVIGGDGISCLTQTQAIEAELGEVISRELQEEYYEESLRNDLAESL